MKRKIVMLNTRFDDEINDAVWKAGEVYEIEDTRNEIYVLKEINDIPYGVFKDSVDKEFVYVSC